MVRGVFALVAEDGPGEFRDGHDQAGCPDSEAGDGEWVVLAWAQGRPAGLATSAALDVLPPSLF